MHGDTLAIGVHSAFYGQTRKGMPWYSLSMAQYRSNNGLFCFEV